MEQASPTGTPSVILDLLGAIEVDIALDGELVAVDDESKVSFAITEADRLSSLPYSHHMLRPSIARLVWIFLRYGNFTFGGGTATTVVIDQEIVERLRLVNRDTARLSYALARLTPGTNVLAYCTGIGWKLRGFPGALSALVAASVPCSVFAVLVTVLYEALIKKHAMMIAIHGAIAAAIAVMFATGWTIIRPLRKSVTKTRLVVLTSAAFVVSILGVSPIQILLGAALLGYLLPGAAGGDQ